MSFLIIHTTYRSLLSKNKGLKNQNTPVGHLEDLNWIYHKSYVWYEFEYTYSPFQSKKNSKTCCPMYNLSIELQTIRKFYIKFLTFERFSALPGPLCVGSDDRRRFVPNAIHLYNAQIRRSVPQFLKMLNADKYPYALNNLNIP